MRYNLALLVVFAASNCIAEDFALHSFERKQLSGTYFSEGAATGDINGDGVNDLIYGPYWFEGPSYEVKREIYKPVPQNMDGYADNFFTWVHDVTGDGWNDVLIVGLPGTPAFVFENPKAAGLDAHWVKHKVMDGVGNESPQFVSIVGDEQPELVCAHDGFFGFATYDPEHPLDAWTFHPILEPKPVKMSAHGLGIGDVNGDRRLDVIHAHGWYEQPAENPETSRWKAHQVSFTQAYGGAEMYAYDVDGDGDNDMITSHAAHDFGLGWYEQVVKDGEVSFTHHLIMGSKPADSKYGTLFTEPHSVNLADIDGDGLKDIVTGKTYWSHHRGSPMWDAGAVVYWFKLVRGAGGVDWIPHQIDSEAGIGRQLVVDDVNADGLPDIVVGGMKGGHVLLHQKQVMTETAWRAAQPKVFAGYQPTPSETTKESTGPRPKMSPRTSRVAGAIEGELMKCVVQGGAANPQNMAGFPADRWSGQSHLWWTGGSPGSTLELQLPPFTGTVDLEIVLTGAKDYGIVQLSLDDQKLGDPIDLYRTVVKTTGVLSFPQIKVDGDDHTLNLKITGANDAAVKSFMVGVDYVRVKQADGRYVVAAGASDGVRAKSAHGRVLNLDFETGTLADWTATGNAFEGQPVKGDTVAARRTDMQSDHEGSYWIGGYELHGDEGIGTLSSHSFVVSQPFASFLAQGGEHERTRVELVEKDSGEVVFQYSGSNSETMVQVVVDLKDYQGKKLFIRLVDQHQGGWGHLNFDHFRLHEQRPAEPTPQKIVLQPDEYPHAGLPATEAAAAMKLPEGFRVTVGATEPAVQQPVAMAIDDRGRVWIAEAFEYPRRADGDKGRDRILIFEDTDGDGTLDSRKVFAEGLNLVSGLEVGFGGVWVGAAPYFMFIPDANGDDVPDSDPQIRLDGWGYQDTHETINAFIWGPDGWLYGCHGVFTHSRVGKPGTPDDQRTALNAGVWRYHPTRHEFDVFAHGTSNPWGVDFNDQGQAFITACVIPHLYHIIQGARYQRQGGQHFNPHTYRDIATIADHLHYLGANPHGGNNRSDSAGGGHAHAGAMIYLGDTWPEEYRGALFMNNIHGQRLNMDRLKPNGSGFVGTHGPDFLLTGDQASQILNVRYGPDGNAWMIDWYDMQACHTGDSSNHDRTNGRIYKISYGEARPQADSMSLAEMSDIELAKLVLQKNDWYVRHSRRLLQERASVDKIDSPALEFLRKVARTHTDATRRLRAMWALHVIGGTNAVSAREFMADASPFVRGWAIQLAMESSKNEPSEFLCSLFTKMAREDSSPVVRLYLASAAQKITPQNRWKLLEALCTHSSDADDHNLPQMYWYAAEPLADVDPSRAWALAMQAGEAIPLLRDFMLRRIGSKDDAGESLNVLIDGLQRADSDELQLTYLKAIRAALRGQRQVAEPPSWDSVSTKLLRSADPNVRVQAMALGVTFGDSAASKSMRELITKPNASVESRLIAIESMLSVNDAKLAPTFLSLLDTEGKLREAAIQGLAQFDSPAVASTLVSQYGEFNAEEKRVALGTLCARANSGMVLLQAIESKVLPSTDLTADLVQQLQFLKNSDLTKLLGAVWGTVRESAADKLAMLATYKELVESKDQSPPSLSLGRAMFAKTCMKCHTLYGVGEKIGPDLTGSNRANLDYLLSNIVDPSAVMAKEYLPTILLTDSGRFVSGLVKAEDARSITIQTSDAQLIVPKDEIEERRLGDKSVMPDDQLKQFSEHEVRSLIAYLRGKEQVPLLATAENQSTFFNGKDFSGWHGHEGLWSVENGELVGRTDGLQQNQWIVSELAARDFHLTLDVKLVDNAGNSGIQFRSHAHDGEVSGYQADIGAGWWGKLYEEHGRGLLWDESGESHVKLGEWNRYEVIAKGHKVRTFINGKLCVDLDDEKGATEGIVAFQLHSGGKTEVRYKNIELRVSE